MRYTHKILMRKPEGIKPGFFGYLDIFGRMIFERFLGCGLDETD
jgi:hypothetical protein